MPPTVLGGLVAGLTLLLAGTAWGRAAQTQVSASRLDAYTGGVARAWEPYTTADGRVADPLDPADTGDNYGVIMLADVMLKVARRTGDSALEATGERILDSVLNLPVPNDPFNLLSLAAVIRDGEDGVLPAGVWERISGPLMQRAGQIGPPKEETCLIEPGCYDNWRLVWSAGAALLLSDGVGGPPGSLASEGVNVAAQIKVDLAMAVTYAGAPLHAATTPPLGGRARELSDPGAEPPAYELFSIFMLELIGEVDPTAITPAVARLRRQADRYALAMMAPDGQLSLSGRSLDQSWVQAAAAALGARRAALDPAHAGAWRAYAERAVSYLFAAYPLAANGVLPIVPGLGLRWDPSIMDGYAALNQYQGLTLWLLSDALAHWPRAQASRTALPADNGSLLVEDLASSGLVWGRSARVWWELSGRTTGADPRSAQGLVAVKVNDASGWRDVLALRPRQHGPSSVWTLGLPHGDAAAPTFTSARGSSRRVVLRGVYRRANGRFLARATWTLRTTATGIRVSMSVPAKATLRATVWLAGTGSRRLYARGGATTLGTCVVTASGQACPVTIDWRKQRAATLEVGA
jgi:hypothetical protein